MAVLDLQGTMIGMAPCPYQLTTWVKRHGQRDHSCGMQASLVLFRSPFGVRSYCEEGHVVALSTLSLDKLTKPFKSPTD